MTVLSYADYVTEVNTLLPDNSTQLISPIDVRTCFTDLAASVAVMLSGGDVNANNIGSSDVRTTRVGEQALSKIFLPGRYTEDNTAVGYYSMGGNYSGIDNTAVGSYALGCNLYGSHNVGVGFNSLPGNITGSGNVGVGNYTLLLNKHGDFNIAIGNAAGYYIGQNDNFKFYLGSFAEDQYSLCSAMEGSGNPPLLFGDLKSLVLGVGVKTLHSYGALQVSGNITSYTDKGSNLGDPACNWRAAYIASGIGYASGQPFNISRMTPSGDTFSQTIIASVNGSGNIAISGKFTGMDDVPLIIEGVLQNLLTSGTSISPTSGILSYRDAAWSVLGTQYIVNKNPSLSIPSGSYVVAQKINNSYRPINNSI